LTKLKIIDVISIIYANIQNLTFSHSQTKDCHSSLYPCSNPIYQIWCKFAQGTFWQMREI